MGDDITSLIEESINLELYASEIYLHFHKLFPMDSAFWWDLALEEKAHAALYRSGQEVFAQLNMFPLSLLHENLEDLKDTNHFLDSLIKSFKNSPPSREEAFNIALQIENSAAERHFQNFMENEDASAVVNFFKELNKDDKDHELRIRSYMEKNGIPVLPAEE